MAKESLFNILHNHFYFEDVSVIDLFAGTGNISYEFASRSTTDIYAIDSHFACIKFIRDTANKFEFSIHPYKSDVYKFLEKTSLKTDIIFADPPYDFKIEKLIEIADLVFQNKILKSQGILIIEHSKHTDMSDHPNFSYSRKYGGNKFSFFKELK